MKKLLITSNAGWNRNYEIEETDDRSILNLAQEFGRADTGEILILTAENGETISRCFWDSQYRKYKKY